MGNLVDTDRLAIYDAEGVVPFIQGSEKLIKDTIGWTTKNLLKNIATSQVVNGITYVVNTDGTIIASGTADANSYLDLISQTIPSGDYILTGCPAGGGSNTYRIFVRSGSETVANDDGDGAKFSTSAEIVRIAVFAGVTVSNLVFKPMIRKADVLDDTYEPFHVAGAIGGHNIKDGDDTSYPSRSTLKFNGFEVSDDNINDETVVDCPVAEVPTEEEWNSITPDPNVSYHLPWMQTGDMLTHERTPIGTIIPFMGTTAPDDYLACDGHQEKKTDYPKLIAFFESTFTSETAPSGDPSDPFGDGNTPTGYFVLPNLQGEFLRGAGTNGHSGEGSGSTVGTHQDATLIPNCYATDTTLINVANSVTNTDANRTGKTRSLIARSSNDTAGTTYTTRPTNTSVLWCIKAKQSSNVITFADVDDTKTTEDNVWSAAKTKEAIKDVYSITEQVVGTWVDGKPIYRKVIELSDNTNYTEVDNRREFVWPSILQNVDSIISQSGYYKIVTSATLQGNKYSFLAIGISSNMSSVQYIGRVILTSSAEANANVAIIKTLGTTKVNGAVVLEYTKTTDQGS